MVHGHSAYPIFGLLLRIASWILGVPAVLTIYSPIGSNSHLKDSQNTLTNLYFIRMFFLSGVWLIPTSDFVKYSLENAGLSPQAKIYPIVNLNSFKPLDEELKQFHRQNHSLSTSSFVIFYLGNLRLNKGLHDLLDALENIRRLHENLNLTLLLALDMPPDVSRRRLESQLRCRSLHNITKHVGITPDVGTLMSISDIVVIPFRNTVGPADPPLSILEAMAAGSTVLTTAVGGIPEVVIDRENGFLVSPGNPKELAERIYELIENPSLRKIISVNAPVTIQSCCNDEAAGLLHMKLYNQIVR